VNTSINPAERVRFGTFELNVRTGELVSIGTAAVEAMSAKVQLRQQPFQVLRILVERQGNIVTREEIRQIFGRTIPSWNLIEALTLQWAILRKALADDADHPKYIETLTGRGYRLIAPVEWQPSQTAAECLLETASRNTAQDRRPNK